MKFYDLTLVIIFTVIAVSALVGGISVYFLGPDNEVEKVSEDIIEDELPALKQDLEPKLVK